MKRVNYQTSILEDGSPNPTVAANTISLSASGLPPLAVLTATLIYDNLVSTANIAADANGNVSNLVLNIPAGMKTAAACLGAGGGWADITSKWDQPFVFAGKPFLFLIEASV